MKRIVFLMLGLLKVSPALCANAEPKIQKKQEPFRSEFRLNAQGGIASKGSPHFLLVSQEGRLWLEGNEGEFAGFHIDYKLGKLLDPQGRVLINVGKSVYCQPDTAE